MGNTDILSSKESSNPSDLSKVSSSSSDDDDNDESEYNVNDSRKKSKRRDSPRCVFIADNLHKDEKYLTKMILKNIKLRRVDPFSEQPERKAGPPPKYIIRFINGRKFCEVATYLESEYRKWKDMFIKLCINSTFNKEYNLIGPLPALGQEYYLANLIEFPETRYVVHRISKMKILSDPLIIGRLKNEINFMRDVECPSNIMMYQIYEDEITLCLVYESVFGPSLENTLQVGLELKETEILCIIRDIVTQLEAMHRSNYVYRSITPRNIALREPGKPSSTNQSVFITFQNCVNLTCKEVLKYNPGSIGFMAPELMSPVISVKNIDFFKADIFSLGVILYSLMTRKEAFDTSTSENLFLSNQKNQIREPNQDFNNFSSGLKSLVLKMIDTSPQERPSARDILNSNVLTQKSPTIKATIKAFGFVKQLIQRSDSNQDKTLFSNQRESLKNKARFSLAYNESFFRRTGNSNQEQASPGIDSSPQLKEKAIQQQSAPPKDQNKEKISPISNKSSNGFQQDVLILSGRPKILENRAKQDKNNLITPISLKQHSSPVNTLPVDNQYNYLQGHSEQVGMSEKLKKKMMRQQSLKLDKDLMEGGKSNRPISLSINRNNLSEISRQSVDFEHNNIAKVSERFAVGGSALDHRILRVRNCKAPKTMRTLTISEFKPFT